MHSLYLAWRYIAGNPVRSTVLIACISLIGSLPLLLSKLLDASERQLTARADSTPLIIGAKGSDFELVMNTLYFSEDRPQTITMADSEAIWESGLADAIPMYVRFKARDQAIVATSLEYFQFRDLEVAEGRLLGRLGEAVLGAEVALHLGLKPGDTLTSTPENAFDLAGVYPLKMRVVGILKRKHNADDRAVFVDLKTAWVIEGLGHGHQDVVSDRGDGSDKNTDNKNNNDVVLKRDSENVVANASLVEYTEITDKNVDSFHFHGDPLTYPISAVIAVPYNEKSAVILRGRFLPDDLTSQITLPGDVIDALFENIFRIKTLLDAITGVVAISTLLALLLVFALSLRLRRREVATIFRLGGRRSTIVRLLGAEVLLILMISAAICLLLLFVTQPFIPELVRILLIQ